MEDWKSQPYLRTGQREGVDQGVLAAAILASNAIVATHPSLPPVLTLKHLAYLTGSSYKFIRELVEREDGEPYRVFRVRKRPARNGRMRFRTICVPELPLFFLQKWISRQILTKGRVHQASCAFSPNSRLIDAAQPHCQSRWLIKVDILRFFESISEISVYNAFRRLGYQPLISFEFARLCTRLGGNPLSKRTRRWTRKAPIFAQKIRAYANQRIGHLPQGAPTSPMLSNLVMLDADDELSNLATKFGLTYTRYADDLTFSTESKEFNRTRGEEFIRLVYRVIGRFGFSPNITKTQIIPPRARKIVLGLLVDREGPRLTRDFKNRMRMHIYYLEKEGVGPLKHAIARGFSAVAGLRNHLLGLAAYASQVEPLYGAELKRRIEAAPWPISY